MKFCSYALIIALLTIATSIPVDRGKELAGEKEKSSIQEPTKKTCFFSSVQKGSLEQKERPVKSIVNLTCSGNIFKVETVLNGALKSKNVGSDENPIALIFCRGAAMCDVNIKNITAMNILKGLDICDSHANQLLYQWRTYPGFRDKHIYRGRNTEGHGDVCSMPNELGEYHPKRPHKRLQLLSIRGSQAILETEHVLIHPGIPICRSHQDYVEDMIKKPHSPSPKKSKVMELAEEDTEYNDCYQDGVYIQPQGHCINPLRRAFLDFANEASVTRVCSEKKWTELKATTKARKASVAKRLIDTMLSLMVPDETEEFRKMVENKFVELETWTTGSAEDLDIIMKQISAQYEVSEDRNNRILILSLVANSVSYLKVEKYINGLTPYMYNKAKKFARRKRDAVPEKKLSKYNKFAVESFISFITSPTVMIGLPYGVRKVKLSDGSKIEIPESIRQQSASEIIQMYSKVCQDNNRTDLMLGTSTMYKILNVCAATKREATTCVDYYIAEGMEAFEGLHKIVDSWKDHSLFDDENIKQMKRQLFEASQYFRTDFRLHVKNFSRVADHCANFALSDPSNALLSTPCSQAPHTHTHDLKCERCERANMILEAMKTYAKEFVAEQEKVVAGPDSDQADEVFLVAHKNEVTEIEIFTKHIFEMKKHLLRSSHTNEERRMIITGLQDNECLVTLDFAQKFLPKWHREKQVDYFGKRGVSYHISHVTAQIGGVYVQHSFVHIYEGHIVQDSNVVILTMSHFLAELKKIGIRKVYFRSDNAGAYHCSSTLGSLHWLMETTKMEIGSYTFSETQNGKSNSDRDANRVKRKVKEYISEGGDVTTSLEFFNALKNNPLNGVSVYHGNVTVIEEGNTKWPGISSLNYFIMEKNGIRAKRYGDIGKGILVEKTNFKPINGSFMFSETGSLASSVDPTAEREAVKNGQATKFWYHPKCTTTKTCVKEPEPLIVTEDEPVLNEYIGDLYSCPETGCSATFLQKSNLDNHILKSQHKFLPERSTEMDYALNLFGRSLEEVRDTNYCPTIGAAVEKLKESKVAQTLNLGWALPDKRTRKPFEKDVVEFLTECFNKGVHEKKPMNPLVVSGLMRTLKKGDGSPRFSADELKTVPQISNFFNRLSDKRKHDTDNTADVTTTPIPPQQPVAKPKKGKSSTHHRRRRHRQNTDIVEVGEYVESEDEHEHAGLIRLTKSEEYWTTEDEFYKATLESKVAAGEL